MAWVKDFDTTEALEAAKARWAEKLYGLTPRQIQYGLDNMGRHYEQYPPNVNQFLSLCKCQGDGKRGHPSHRTYVAISLRPDDKSVGEAHLQKIRQDLYKKRAEEVAEEPVEEIEQEKPDHIRLGELLDLSAQRKLTDDEKTEMKQLAGISDE